MILTMVIIRILTLDGPRPATSTRWRPVAAAVGLAALAVSVRRGAVVELDRAIHRTVASHRPARGAYAARAVTMLGETPVAYPVLAAVLLVRSPDSAAATLAVAGVAKAARRLLAEIVDRPRPPHADWLADASGPSFPSRHTATATLVAGLFADAVGAPESVVHGIAVAVAISRVWLGVHWASDVAGGWLYAAGWLALARALGIPDRSR